MLLAVASGAASADPGVSCGSVIDEDTKLTGDLLGCVDGVEVAGSGITFDLAGHTISGTGAGTGIRITGQEATVKNGTVTQFGAGVAAGRPEPDEAQATFHLKSLHLVENGAGVSLGGASAFGTGDSTIESSRLDRNMSFGLAFDRFRLRVTDTSIRQNGGSGVFQSEAVGVFVHNDISDNGGDGLNTFSPFSIVLVDNTMNRNAGSGFFFSTAFGDPYPRLERNRAEHNGKVGLWVIGAPGMSRENLDGGGNSAKLNGDRRQCLIQEQPLGRPPVVIDGALACERNPPRRR